MNIIALQESNGLSPFALTYWKKENEGSCFSPQAAVATAVAVTQPALSMDEIGQDEGWVVLDRLQSAMALHDFCAMNILLPECCDMGCCHLWQCSCLIQ